MVLMTVLRDSSAKKEHLFILLFQNWALPVEEHNKAEVGIKEIGTGTEIWSACS